MQKIVTYSFGFLFLIIIILGVMGHLGYAYVQIDLANRIPNYISLILFFIILIYMIFNMPKTIGKYSGKIKYEYHFFALQVIFLIVCLILFRFTLTGFLLSANKYIGKQESLNIKGEVLDKYEKNSFSKYGGRITTHYISINSEKCGFLYFKVYKSKYYDKYNKFDIFNENMKIGSLGIMYQD